MKKITMATLKSFIRKNTGKLYIKNLSDFDGMTDGIEQCENRGFREARETEDHVSNSLGIGGVWCVGHSGDYFNAYDSDGFTGIEVNNCCGNFVLAVTQQEA